MRQLRHCKWAPDAAKWAGVAPEPTAAIQQNLISKASYICNTKEIKRALHVIVIYHLWCLDQLDAQAASEYIL